ncbi:unnamed protein product, partial [Prorocentrum cordatum]
ATRRAGAPRVRTAPAPRGGPPGAMARVRPEAARRVPRGEEVAQRRPRPRGAATPSAPRRGRSAAGARPRAAPGPREETPGGQRPSACGARSTAAARP